MKNVIITGGAGFIGSNLIRQLLRNNCKITCIDNFDPFYSLELKKLNLQDFNSHPHFKLLNIDLAKITPLDLIKFFDDPVDAIIHLAAKVGVRPSVENPLDYQYANVIVLQNMLDFAKEKKVMQFVFASSSSVYGINAHFPWKEDEQLLPVSPYAMTKLAGEMLGHVYYHLYGIRFIALRFFTVYGPAQRPDLAIHKFTKAILKREPIPVFGEGRSSRDYTFVSDIVSGIEAAMNYDKTGFEIINLGNNHPMCLIDLICLLEKIIGEKALIQKLPEQPGDVPKTFADIGKAKQLLGYRTDISIEEGLKIFVDWFLKNKILLTK